ncbi:MAG: hypothetical protein WCB68_10115 [Pyrinomonadaceae bacterium]
MHRRNDDDQDCKYELVRLAVYGESFPLKFQKNFFHAKCNRGSASILCFADDEAEEQG